jgi:hypothetical protein
MKMHRNGADLRDGSMPNATYALALLDMLDKESRIESAKARLKADFAAFDAKIVQLAKDDVKRYSKRLREYKAQYATYTAKTPFDVRYHYEREIEWMTAQIKKARKTIKAGKAA